MSIGCFDASYFLSLKGHDYLGQHCAAKVSEYTPLFLDVVWYIKTKLASGWQEGQG